MRTRRPLIILGCLLTITLLGAGPARAQTELEHARASLTGVDGFYLSVNMEGPAAILAHEALDLPVLGARMAERLRDAGLPLRSEAGLPAAERLPYLHVHVNLMQADRGQIPFAVEIRFFQAVHLARDAGRALPAATWETSLVGLSYHNQLPFIADTATELLDEFVQDFQRVNL